MSKQIPIHDQDKQTNVYLNAKWHVCKPCFIDIHVYQD